VRNAIEVRKEYEPFLKSLKARLSVMYPGRVTGRLKAVASIAEKNANDAATENNYDGDARNMSDIAGVRITMPLDEFYATQARIKRDFNVVNTKDYLEEPLGETAYRAIHMTIEENGQRAELQFRTPNQTTWADWQHETVYKMHGPAKQQVLISTNKQVISDYARDMSDYFFKVDSHEPADKPPCTTIISQSVGCL